MKKNKTLFLSLIGGAVIFLSFLCISAFWFGGFGQLFAYIVGERSSCTCTFSEKIPVTAPPGKTVALKINARLPKYDSSFDQTVTFMIQEPKRLVMEPVRITATIPSPLPKPATDSSDAK